MSTFWVSEAVIKETVRKYQLPEHEVRCRFIQIDGYLKDATRLSDATLKSTMWDYRLRGDHYQASLLWTVWTCRALGFTEQEMVDLIIPLTVYPADDLVQRVA
ncbi:MAG: hypothetical protein AAB582_00405 [Patescibacteria group bacterium]